MDHVQRPTPGWNNHLGQLPAGCVKGVDQGGVLVEAKKINPKLHTTLRHWNDSLQHYDGNTDEAVWIGRARHWFSTFIDGTFIDQYAQYVDSVSWHNEIWANSQNDHERLERIVGTNAAIKVWNNEYRTQPKLSHIKLVVGEAAVGNWIPREVIAAAIKFDCLVGYHPYTAYGWDNMPKQRWPHDWESLSGLWDVMEYDYGLRPTWIFTECGPYSGPVTGWRSSEVCGGDLGLYVAAVRAWLRDVQRTPAYKEGRIVGLNLFTTGGGDQWKTFETGGRELDELAKMYAIEWRPGQAPQPDPDPDPPPDPDPDPPADQEWERFAWDQSIKQQTISLNPAALLQKAILLDGLVPVSGEFWLNWGDGQRACQAAEDLGDGQRRVYWADVPKPGQSWEWPEWFGEPDNLAIESIITELPTHPTRRYERRDLDEINTIVIHHTVTAAPPESFARYHVDSRGWPGIGYHFLIYASGHIYQTNHLETISEHTGPGNLQSIGVALVGDFTHVRPSARQLNATRALISYLRQAYPWIMAVKGHKEMPGASTQCPGNTWPEWRDKVR